MPVRKPLRIAISSILDESTTRAMPEGVEVVRYQTEKPVADEVDMLVPPGLPGLHYDAQKLLTTIRARYVQTMSAGVEAVLPFIPQGTVLCNARGVHDGTTAEWTVTAILASLKWLPFYAALQREGRWSTRADSDAHWVDLHGSPGTVDVPVALEELAGKTVLIVGYGSIGKAIETRLAPCEPARILRLARTAREGVEPVSALHSLLPEADVVVLITPLTPETRHLIGREELARMRPGTLVVNAARGGVIDTEALVEALNRRHVRAALDVTDPQPLPAGHPLWQAPNLLLTPHIAGSSPDLLDRVFRFVARQAQHLLKGEEPENIIRGAY